MRRACFASTLLLVGLAATPCGAEEAATPGPQGEKATTDPASAPGEPDLDRLLQPRLSPLTTPEGSAEVRGGRDRDHWREQFESLHKEIDLLELTIGAKQEKLRDASDGNYQYAPPGAGGAATDPEVLRLRAELKRDRTSLEATRRRLRELEIEASLAGVPRDWIR